MSQTLRIKVRTEALVERVEAALVKAKAAYAKDLAAYEKRGEGYNEKAAAAFMAAAELAKVGKFKTPRYGYVTSLPGWPEQPDKPTDREVKSIERDLNLLKMSAQDSMTISVDGSFGRYL